MINQESNVAPPTTTNQSIESNQEQTSKVRIKKPNSIVLDVYGVLTSHQFKIQLKQHVRDHLQEYLDQNWTKRRVKSLFRKLCTDADKLGVDHPELPRLKFDEELFQPTVNGDAKFKAIQDMNTYVAYRMDHRLYGDNLLLLWGEVWQFGYMNGSLKAHVYEEVPRILEHWRMRLFIKLYTLASGQSQGQKMFFQHTTAGDLSSFIANYMDPSSIGKTNEKCFKAIIYALRDKPENLVYLTDNVTKLKVATSSNVRTVLVIRPDTESPTEEELKDIPDLIRVNSLSEIEFEDSSVDTSKDCC